MDEKTLEEIRKIWKEELDGYMPLLKAKIDNLDKAINLRFENLKKVIGDYLELSSNLSIASVKANLKNV